MKDGNELLAFNIRPSALDFRLSTSSTKTDRNLKLHNKMFIKCCCMMLK